MAKVEGERVCDRSSYTDYLEGDVYSTSSDDEVVVRSRIDLRDSARQAEDMAFQLWLP